MRSDFMRWLLVLALGAACAARGVAPLESLALPQPYAPDQTWPKLTAAQWTGDPEVDAVVILSIDDMRDPTKYEEFLRPILNRLAEVGAPGAMSIFTRFTKPSPRGLSCFAAPGANSPTAMPSATPIKT